MDSFKIKNISVTDSIRLSAVQTDKFKAGMISFSLSSPTTAKGVAFSTVLCGVLKRSNEKFPAVSDVYKRLDELYSSTLDIRIAFNASELSLTVSSELLDNSYAIGTDVLDGVIELVSLALLRPLRKNGAFPTSAVAREVETVRSALLAEKNNTQSYALIRCKEMLNRQSESYPSLEELVSALDKITPESLWSFYTQVISYAPLDVFYVGGESPSTVADKLSLYFKNFKPTVNFDIGNQTPDSPLPFEKKQESLSVSQSKLVMGFHTGIGVTDGDYHSALVFNELFGCSPISRLFMNVRERLGLCYYCASSYNVFSGAITVSCGTDLSQINAATEEILKQLGEIKRGHVSESELCAAKSSLINAYRQIYDNPFDINTFYANRIKLGICESVEDCIEAFKNVQIADVVKIANLLVYDTVFVIEGSANGNFEEEDFYE